MFLKLLKLFLKSDEISPQNINPETVKNILIVRQHNQLGDMLCSVPLFAALRKNFPGSSITLVASPINYEILFTDINPYINKVIIYNKSTLLHLYKFIKDLRTTKYEIGIVPSTVSISRTSHFINYISKAAVRVGVRKIDNKYNEVEFLLNIKSAFEWDKKKYHQIERNLDIVRQIGCDLSRDEIDNVKIHFSAEEEQFGEHFICKHFPDRSRMIIAFHPGAGKEKNRWDVRNYEELINIFYERYNNYTLITCGHIDEKITEELESYLKIRNVPFSVIRNTSIRRVASVIKRTDLYVTNDTGTMHVAGLVDVNILSLFGPTKGYEWAPRGINKVYIESSTENINDIKIEEVFKTGCSLIEKIKIKV